MLKKILIILLFCSLFNKSIKSQAFLNGSFETNTCPGGVDQINLTSPAYNAFMSNSISFGTYLGVGDMDILTLATYGLAQQGSWYVAFTGGGTDQISLRLSAPLVMGNPYTIRFYDRAYVSFPAAAFEIGLSTTNNTYGTLIASTGVVPTSSIWTMRTMTFNAPNNGQFITVRTAGALGNWSQVDNFSFVSVLPIELLDFTSHCQNNSVLLNWSTASEKNNDFFSIERSENGIDFIEIGEVKGASNSNQKLNYSFTDRKQLNGTRYYRLQQIDHDKNTSYSTIIVAENCITGSDIDCEIYPNPANDYLSVRIKNFNANCKLKIVSPVGKVVYEGVIESSENNINLTNFDAGIYLIQIINDEKTTTKKFTKN